ncbi:MAG: chlorite dismutase family protein [Acidimicrobiales bacterium]|nr:chlorite dismutase family protein [Acidimicrobiales bacterium]
MTSGTNRPSSGRCVLHLFAKSTPTADRKGVVSAVRRFQESEDQQIVSVATLGHKADVCLMALGPDLWDLRGFQTEIAAAGLEVVDSYVSLTEVSEYAAGMPEEMKQARLYPNLPPDGLSAFCFYPMSKRRNPDQNWYGLDFEERKRLMTAHGAVGREFRGRVVQLVTGSTGLDDFEWGVTLFGKNPDDLKDVVYTMRFDETTVNYSEFGYFVTGTIADIEDVLDVVGLY